MPYLTIDSVPVLDEHNMPIGDTEIRFDSKLLRKVAARNNKRIADTGDAVPITIGHTVDDAPEREQPEIVGYADQFKVKRFFKTGRKALFARFRIFKDKVSLARRFPRRSVEIWFRDWRLDPIALLGASAPDRDLGLLKFAAGGKKAVRTERFNNKGLFMAAETKEIVDDVIAALKQTDVWKFVESLMDETEEEGSKEGGDNSTASEDEAAGEEESAARKDDEEAAADEQAADEDEEESALGGKAKLSRRTRNRYGKGRYGKTFAAKDKRVEALEKELAGVRFRFQKAEREKDLLELAGEGYELDMDEELDRLAPLPSREYEYNLDLIRRRYSRVPVGKQTRFGDFADSRGDRPTTREEAMAIAEQARAKGVSYEQAKREYKR